MPSPTLGHSRKSARSTWLWAPTLPNVVWSLAYEMVFYLMLTALFLGGVHRRSSRYALVFGAAAVALGGILNPGTLSYSLFTPGVVVAITDSVVLAGLVLALAVIFNSGYARGSTHSSLPG
jgi:peptidoglycan/LPS O-acetylase OafA/YrhL